MAATYKTLGLQGKAGKGWAKAQRWGPWSHCIQMAVLEISLTAGRNDTSQRGHSASLGMGRGFSGTGQSRRERVKRSEIQQVGILVGLYSGVEVAEGDRKVTAT